MLRRIFDVGGARLELTFDGMEYDGAEGKLEELLARLKSEGVKTRGGGETPEAMVEDVTDADASLYTTEAVLAEIRHAGFSVEERPPGGGGDE